MNLNTLRGIGAVLAGMIIIVALSTGTDLALESFGVFPRPDQGQFIAWMLAVALGYRSVYAVVGGYLTAVLAPNRPLRHAVILGAVGVVLTILGSIAMWNKSHAWYPLALIATALPCTWLGGKLRGEAVTSL